ncbi:MAG: pyridoxamine 5'-phosphate oxidase family protein [Ilumatobacter sp.]
MSFYSEPQRSIQDHYGTRPLADRLEMAIVATELDDGHAAFISSRDFFFLSTVNGSGEPTVSYKGGPVGCVRVLDPTTIAFPAYDGNGMFLSMGNIEDTAKIGLLFIDFETPNRVRLQATASFSADDALCAEFPGAIGIVRAKLDAVFVNCARYIHRHERVQTSEYVPDQRGEAPHPSWKRIDGLQDVLSVDEQSRTDEMGGTITDVEYGERLMRGES